MKTFPAKKQPAVIANRRDLRICYTVIKAFITLLIFSTPFSQNIYGQIVPATANAGPDQKICGQDFLSSGKMIQLQGSFGGSADSGTFYCLDCIKSEEGVTSTKTTIGICPPPSNCSFSYTPTIIAVVPGEPCEYKDSTVYKFVFVTNDPPGPAGPASDTALVTIYSYPQVFAGEDQKICAGDKVTLKGKAEKISINGCSQTGLGTWTGGTGSFEGSINNNGGVTDVYTPSTSEIAAGSVELYLVSTLPFGVESCSTAIDTVIITLKQCDYFCTYGQGFYGSKNGESCTSLGKLKATEMITRSIFNMPGHTLYIGAGSESSADGGSLTITSDQATIVNSILPGGGPSSVLSGDYNFKSIANYPPLKNKRLKNALLAQTITLALNVYLVTDKDNFAGNIALNNEWLVTREKSSLSTCSHPLPASCTENPEAIKSWHLPPSVINELGANNSVQDLLKLAGQALAGNLPKGVTLQEIASAEETLNSAFEECRYLAGTSACEKTCSNIDEKCPPSAIVQRNTETLINGSKNLQVTVFPNPYSDHLKFMIQSPVSGQGTLDIYNLPGQKIHVFSGSFYAGELKTIDYHVPVQFRKSLFYILKIGNQQVSGKVINLTIW